MTDSEPREAKQLIVMRTDLNMRRGKQIAQGCHAALAFLTRHGDGVHMDVNGAGVLDVELTPAQVSWIRGAFVKICVRVDSEEELLQVVRDAELAGLTVHLITDAGRTEFHGVPTPTCAAIGPHFAEDIDPVTQHLRLL
jgi:PTH2 family peptidyl-tRNA hydrolase